MSIALSILVYFGVFATAHAERLISVQNNLAWMPRPNSSRWIETDRLPTDAPITGAYVLAVFHGRLLIARHRERGWDIPGGHVDPGETPEETAVRETFEETAARITGLRLIAIQRLHIDGPKPPGYKYPYPTSYQALYLADVISMGPFVEEEDTVERLTPPCERALGLVPWIDSDPDLRAVFAASISSR